MKILLGSFVSLMQENIYEKFENLSEVMVTDSIPAPFVRIAHEIKPLNLLNKTKHGA